MWKNILLATLWIALVIEVGMTVGGFVVPATLLSSFQLPADPGTLFLGYIVAWFLMLASAIIALAIWYVRKNDCAGWMITYVIGGWWVLIGIAIYLYNGRPDNLFIDSLKGAILVVSALKCCPTKKKR